MQPNGIRTCFTLRGLPFDASYACTSMHEVSSHLLLTNHSQSIDTQPRSQALTQPGAGPSWAYSPYLLLDSLNKEECGTTHNQSIVCMHTCVCSNQCNRKREVGVSEQLSGLSRITSRDRTGSPP